MFLTRDDIQKEPPTSNAHWNVSSFGRQSADEA
jgi:hypothetical protein